MRQSLGTAVFAGMLGVTVFGLLFTPVFYTAVRRIGGRRRDPAGAARRRRGAPDVSELRSATASNLQSTRDYHEDLRSPRLSQIRLASASCWLRRGWIPTSSSCPVDLIGAEHKQPAFLEKNPSGVVPVLQLDDGTYIAEATAITEYLDNLDGTRGSLGRRRGKGCHPHDAEAGGNRAARRCRQLFSSRDAGPRRRAAGVQEPRMGRRVREWGYRQRDKALAGMAYFDAVLQDYPFVAGDASSMADIAPSGLLVSENSLPTFCPGTFPMLY